MSKTVLFIKTEEYDGKEAAFIPTLSIRSIRVITLDGLHKLYTNSGSIYYITPETLKTLTHPQQDTKESDPDDINVKVPLT